MVLNGSQARDWAVRTRPCWGGTEVCVSAWWGGHTRTSAKWGSGSSVRIRRKNVLHSEACFLLCPRSGLPPVSFLSNWKDGKELDFCLSWTFHVAEGATPVGVGQILLDSGPDSQMGKLRPIHKGLLFAFLLLTAVQRNPCHSSVSPHWPCSKGVSPQDHPVGHCAALSAKTPSAWLGPLDHSCQWLGMWPSAFQPLSTR